MHSNVHNSILVQKVSLSYLVIKFRSFQAGRSMCSCSLEYNLTLSEKNVYLAGLQELLIEMENVFFADFLVFNEAWYVFSDFTLCRLWFGRVVLMLDWLTS
ncbi:hypothetical protein M758_6G137900 [Ceratodon purpureus]|nr:hypothetical protein M758_6G137900 [Ceratodon purpureus]